LKPDVINACTQRQQRLRGSAPFSGLDALLISHEKDIRYLTDFVGHDSLLLVAGGWSAIISDPRYDEFLDPWRDSGLAEIVMGTRHRLDETLQTICRSRGVRALGVQSDCLTMERLERLKASLKDVSIKPVSGAVSALRRVKDAVELRAIERAIDIQQQALAAALGELQFGMTELELSGLIDYHMKSRGATGESFEPIIGAGANSSIIHHATSTSPVQPGVLLVDWGAMYGGYCGDLTRTFAVGETPAKLREVYAIVLEAQLAAIAAIAPGKSCAAIDKVARDVIAKSGYGERFAHGLGHGLGMDVHEEPYFNSLATDVLLQPGMVMTVEPGVYIPGVGGVRIEDDVVVTERGCRVLSSFPKGLDDMTIQPGETLSPAAAGRLA